MSRDADAAAVEREIEFDLKEWTAVFMEMKIYKSGQGYNTRLWTGIILFAIIAVGCYRLHGILAESNIWVQNLVPAVLCAGLGFVIFWILNKPNIADFMIASEGEIKKVSWSSRTEIAISTFIVILVVVLMCIVLWLVDMGFQLLFQSIGIY